LPPVPLHARTRARTSHHIAQAVASARVLLGPDAFDLVRRNAVKKGDVLTVAQIAGVMGAKNTSTLIPLCHPVAITKIDVALSLSDHDHAVVIRATATATGQTGVEMEALTAVSVAALTCYDMCKAVTHDIIITDVQLESKTGGQRGDFFRAGAVAQ
jgi:molybdenum cofactor biosynthesis protein MoaC